jgi:hypothetical protein
MVEHSLAIRSFETRLALTGRREDALPFGRELGRVVRDILPAAISAALTPLLGSRDGVLRINRIALELRFERGEMSGFRLADLLARDIVRAIAERAGGASALPRIGAGFAYWPDHASYAAAYLGHRLRLAPAPDWAFSDLRPLGQLAPHEAALELIAARPAILAALARLVGAAAASALAASLPEPTAALLIERVVSGAASELPAGAEAELAAMGATLTAEIEAGPARAAIAAAAAALSARAAAQPEDVRSILMLARVAVALAAFKAAAPATWGRAPVAADLAAESVVHLPEPARRLAQAALVPLARTDAARAALIRLVERSHRRVDAAEPATTRAARSAAVPRAITSRLAGIGLLMPAALAHGLPERLSAAALNRTLAATAGAEAETAARLDPLLAALAPFDPRDRGETFPPVPDSLRATVPEVLREGAAASEGAIGWAACLIHAFAAGLAGFETSSLSYLRRQFLARPGTLHSAEHHLTLVLEPLPLGVVLRLSGLHGWTGRLPQARDALLRLEIRES